MAAPADKTTKNLSGTWNLNKSISGNADPGLALQGIGYLTRTGISMASISIEINQYEAPPKEGNPSTDIVTHIDLDQTAAGISTTQEKRCLDDVSREHNDKIFGKVKGQSQWVSIDDIKDDFLKGGWEVEGNDSKELIRSFVESQPETPDASYIVWTAEQIWGFQTVNGERRYCRNIVITKFANEEKKEATGRHEFRFVYDYQA